MHIHEIIHCQGFASLKDFPGFGIGGADLVFLLIRKRQNIQEQ